MLYFTGIIRHIERNAGTCCKGDTSPSKVHGSTSCCVIGDISIRGHSTSLADFL
jgi:hypothetical protein